MSDQYRRPPRNRRLHLQPFGNQRTRLHRAANTQPEPNVVGDLWCRYDEGVVCALRRQQPDRIT